MKINDVKSWGVDVGNVLIKNVPYNTQSSYLEKNTSPEVIVNNLQLIPDALVGLRFLVHHVGKENVWIISKASFEQAYITRLAFEKFRFYLTTGLDPEQVLFVPEKLDKLPVIKVLELEGHIDDRGEIIAGIQDIVKAPVWFRPEAKDSVRWLPGMKYNTRVISSWKKFMEIFG